MFPDTKLCHVAQLSTNFEDKDNKNNYIEIYVKLILAKSNYIICMLLSL